MQGTQDHDRIATWERRDIVIPALAKWMGGLGVVVVIVMVILVGMFAGLMSFERNRDKVPSPVFTQRVPPPMPHLYPNPDDAAALPLEPLAGPDDFYHREKAVEDTETAKVGLLDPKTGLAAIPDAAMQKVLARSGSQTATEELPRMEMPSEGSGGLRTDNRLR
jgi:hypothetical protein